MSQLRNNCGDCDRSDAALINGFSRKHSLMELSGKPNQMSMRGLLGLIGSRLQSGNTSGCCIYIQLITEVGLSETSCEGNAEIAPSLFQERQILPVSLTKSHLDRSSVKQEQKYLQLF